MLIRSPMLRRWLREARDNPSGPYLTLVLEGLSGGLSSFIVTLIVIMMMTIVIIKMAALEENATCKPWWLIQLSSRDCNQLLAALEQMTSASVRSDLLPHWQSQQAFNQSGLTRSTTTFKSLTHNRCKQFIWAQWNWFSQAKRASSQQKIKNGVLRIYCSSFSRHREATDQKWMVEKRKTNLCQKIWIEHNQHFGHSSCKDWQQQWEAKRERTEWIKARPTKWLQITPFSIPSLTLHHRPWHWSMLQEKGST